MQLFHMKNLFKTCRFAKEVLEQFDSLPGHLTEDLHLFSLNDLSAVRNGDLAPRMKELLKLGTIHAAGCVLCQAKGFVCEFCGNDKDIIFPFQLNKCQRCEGEPSLLVAGLGGSRAPSPRPAIQLTWRDWKISKPRRLARLLSLDRKEGEGGEEDLKLDIGHGVESGEERWETAKKGQGKGTLLQTFTPGNLMKAFSWNKGRQEEQETTGGTESMSEETNCDNEEEGGTQGEVLGKGAATSKERGDVFVRREKVNILKVFNLEGLKKSVSGSEPCSSMESLEEVGLERKGQETISGFASIKSFSKRERENEEETQVKVEEFGKRYLEKAPVIERKEKMAERLGSMMTS
uniref:Rubicon Homology domain-containing protein n=1 Tax=Labrus bergylta TaxID=56723 RepID=A0A3Q3NFX9_9LABR